MRSVLLFLFTAMLVTAAENKAPIHIDTTPDGIRYSWLGEKPTQPAPTVFFMGGTVEDGLGQAHHREGLEQGGKSGVFYVTIDLPSHGHDLFPGEPGMLNGWAFRLEKGDDFIGHFVKRASSLLDYLIAQKLTDPKKIGVIGISRGGFMGLQLAAVDARVRHVAVFAPVTDLTVLTEFQKMIGDPRATSRNALFLADRLINTNIWIIIGSTDNRVGTGHTIQFAQRVIEAATIRGQQPKIELHVEPSVAHTVPEGSYLRGGIWLRKLLEIK